METFSNPKWRQDYFERCRLKDKSDWIMIRVPKVCFKTDSLTISMRKEFWTNLNKNTKNNESE